MDGVGIMRVDTGLTLGIPTGMRMAVEPVDGVYIISHRLDKDGRLTMLVDGGVAKGDVVAVVWIEESKRVPIRFLEKGTNGVRIIRGTPVESRIEN
jgi:hypothetical protein